MADRNTLSAVYEALDSAERTINSELANNRCQNAIIISELNKVRQALSDFRFYIRDAISDGENIFISDDKKKEKLKSFGLVLLSLKNLVQ